MIYAALSGMSTSSFARLRFARSVAGRSVFVGEHSGACALRLIEERSGRRTLSAEGFRRHDRKDHSQISVQGTQSVCYRFFCWSLLVREALSPAC